jgi:uncharacterized protein involved in exopolysaccharide biosynthesis
MLSDAVAVARRRRALMLVVFLAAVLGGGMAVLRRAHTYRAEAFLMVAQPAPAAMVSSSEVPVVADVMGATRARSVATHVEAIKTPAVLGRAYDGLPARTRKVFGGSAIKRLEDLPVKVEVIEDSDIVSIAVRSRNRQAAAAFANRIAQQHIRYTQEFNRSVARSALSYLETELAAARDKVEEAERALLTEKMRSQLFNAQGQIASKSTAAIEAQQHADQAAIEYRIAQTQLGMLRAAIAREAPMPVTLTREDRNPLADSLRSSAVHSKVRRAGMLVDFSAVSPEVREIDAQISAAEKSLSSEKPRQGTTEEKSLNTVREQLRQQAIQLEATAEAAAARERENRALYERYVKELYELNAAQAKLLKLTTAADVLRENYRLLRTRWQNVAMGAQARLPDVNILSLAEVPRVPVGPGKLILGLFAIFVSALLACGAAWLAELFSPKTASLH